MCVCILVWCAPSLDTIPGQIGYSNLYSDLYLYLWYSDLYLYSRTDWVQRFVCIHVHICILGVHACGVYACNPQSYMRLCACMHIEAYMHWAYTHTTQSYIYIYIYIYIYLCTYVHTTLIQNYLARHLCKKIRKQFECSNIICIYMCIYISLMHNPTW